MGKMQSKTKNVSRRKIFKKVKSCAKFIIPTIVTFNVSKLHAESSAPPGPPDW